MSPESIRKQYEQHGVRPYYEQFGAGYRNPHEAALSRAIQSAADAWGRIEAFFGSHLRR